MSPQVGLAVHEMRDMKCIPCVTCSKILMNVHVYYIHMHLFINANMCMNIMCTHVQAGHKESAHGNICTYAGAAVSESTNCVILAIFCRNK